jgi:lysophospholipase L1-like esterase
MKKTTGNIQLCISAFLLFLILSVSLATHCLSFDNTRIFFAGDSSTTYCRESSGGADLYQQSLFSRLQASPPPGFIIEPQQAIISRDPCGISDPDGSGYGGLKILDWNTECTDASGNGICGWFCYDCPDPECEINRSELPLGGEADWCCCGSRRACIDQSDAQYVILNLAGNDLLQLFKFYGGDVDLVVAEAKSLTNYVTSQGRTAIWLNFYPIGYGSLGGGETSCSNSLACLFATNSNAEYFYAQFIPWIESQPAAYLIDFFGYIKATYAQNPLSFINTYGYDSIHLKPGGHQIYYNYVYPRLSEIVSGSNDQDGDGVPDASDNCPQTANADQADMDNDGIGNVCDADADGDTYELPADCNDSDAAIHPGATELCGDGKDNNCDLNADCKDTACLGSPLCGTAEICNDGIDNDRDRKVDCRDTDCRNNPVCTGCVVNENPEATCNDGKDNDCDGYTDCNDADCSGNSACLCTPKGGSCTVNSDCCSNRCQRKVCR